MTTGILIIIAILATGVLMMPFRKRWLAKVNIAFTDHVIGLFADSCAILHSGDFRFRYVCC